MAKRRPLTVPRLGSCATAGRAWRLWAASTLPEEGGGTRAPGCPATGAAARVSHLQTRRPRRHWVSRSSWSVAAHR